MRAWTISPVSDTAATSGWYPNFPYTHKRRVFGLSHHLTNGAVGVDSHWFPSQIPTRRPEPPQCLAQGLVQLADMTPCERTKKRFPKSKTP